jgi:hypothetical protein
LALLWAVVWVFQQLGARGLATSFDGRIGWHAGAGACTGLCAGTF